MNYTIVTLLHCSVVTYDHSVLKNNNAIESCGTESRLERNVKVLVVSRGHHSLHLLAISGSLIDISHGRLSSALAPEVDWEEVKNRVREINYR